MSTRARLCETTVELEVPFHDCDPLGIVWHGHYYRYFDAARTRLLRGCGLDAGKLIGGTYLFMVSESRCRHAFPLSYGDRFRVHAWFGAIRHGLDIRFELVNLEHQRRSAKGRTLLVCVDDERKLLVNTPQPIIDRIEENRG